MSHGLLQSILISAVPAAAPLLYAALGELLSEKAGVINIGIEGVMLIGAVAGFAGAVHGGNIVLAMLAGAAAGAAFAGVVVGIPAVLLGVPQILVGFSAWFIGVGLSSQLGTDFLGVSAPSQPAQINLPLLDQIPFVGDILFRQSWPVYLILGLTAAVAFLLSRTRHGLALRSTGEDPSGAYAAGVAVRKLQIGYVCIGGAFVGAGGAVLSAAIAGSFQEGMTAGRGFIALSLVMFVGWRPLALIGATYLFGILLILANVGQSQGWAIPSEFLTMAPYLLTVVALVVRVRYQRWRKTPAAEPAALGAIFRTGT